MTSVKATLGARETIAVNQFDSVRAAARIMAARGVGAVPVLDAGRLVGMFSERDLMERVVAAGISPDATSVGEVMSTELVTADAAESYAACLERMQRCHVRHLIVFEQGSVAGVVSLRDLMAVDISEKTSEQSLLDTYAHYVPSPPRSA